MTKSKDKVRDKLSISEEQFLALADRNLELINQNKELTQQVAELRKEPARNPYLINIKMYLDPCEQTWDFTKLIQMVQFESPALLVKILRTIHHQYAILNIQEQVTALNRHTLSINDYSEQIPNELYVLKTLADNIEAIRLVDTLT